MLNIENIYILLNKIYFVLVGKLVVTISNLSAQHTENSQNIEKNEVLLKTIETHISENMTKMNSNLQSLNTRLEVVAEKLKKSEA